MDFELALSEFANLLTVASQALTRITQIEEGADPRTDAYLCEIEAIADRLHEIGEEFRSRKAAESSEN